MSPERRTAGVALLAKVLSEGREFGIARRCEVQEFVNPSQGKKKSNDDANKLALLVVLRGSEQAGPSDLTSTMCVPSFCPFR